MIDWVTMIIAGITGGSALLLLFQRNLFYAATLLMLTLLGTAALFIKMSAEFVAISQIVVYVGGVLVLIIFGILLTNRISGSPILIGQYRFIPTVLLTGALFYGLLDVLTSSSLSINNKATVAQETVSVIGINLMTENILVFELIAILLLVALVGASTIAESKHK